MFYYPHYMFKPPEKVPHRSIVLWPDEVCLGKIPNESSDTHDSKATAEYICHRLKADGLGGEGKIFPISTRVEEIKDE